MHNHKLFEDKNEGYFDQLPESIQDLVNEMLVDTIDKVSGWKSSDDLVEPVECRSRSGFIPFSSNKGGLIARQFTDLMSLWGSGERVSHKKAQAEIERQIEYNLDYAKQAFFNEYKEELAKLKIKSVKNKKLNYHELYEMKQGNLAERLSEAENECMSGEDNSIMFETRFLYHGMDEAGIHSASVSCAVNTEGPYHRSSIAWAPNVFCEGSKEVEITWKTKTELKKKLTKALEETSGEVF